MLANDVGEGGTIRFKANGRTLLEITEEAIYYKGIPVALDDVAKAFKEMVEQMEDIRTADEVLFRLKGLDAKLKDKEREIRELQVANSKQSLEIAAYGLQIKELRNANSQRTTVTTSGGTAQWHHALANSAQPFGAAIGTGGSA